ncbi:MAG: hypothetical protein ACAH59_11505, partial [Pseudobdellovibrionaceae bacterium]
MIRVRSIFNGFLLLPVAVALGGISQAFAWPDDLKHSDLYEKWKTDNPELASGTDPAKIMGGLMGPERKLKTAKENQELFNQYCIGNSESAEVPNPNYHNDKVMRAARILSKVADLNFYFYSDIKRIYKKGSVAAPSGISENAHLFLIQTCGEFRDRAEIIEGKVKWVNNMIMLGEKSQKNPVDLKANIWTQLSGQSYNRYLELSNQIFSMKQKEAYSNKQISSSLHQEAQEPVDGYSVCETKFIISELIAKNKNVATFDEYKNQFRSFAKKCSQD